MRGRHIFGHGFDLQETFQTIQKLSRLSENNKTKISRASLKFM